MKSQYFDVDYRRADCIFVIVDISAAAPTRPLGLDPLIARGREKEV